MADDESALGDELSAKAGYRDQSTSGKRTPRGLMRYTDDEWAVIVMVAAQEVLKPGAYVQKAAYEAALRQHRGELFDSGAVTTLFAELQENRRVLTNIGGNLNDVAKAANSTGEIENPVAADTVLRLVRNVVLATDELMAKVRTELLP
ncbi:hypothetical protein [Actinokineospora enzanensis]|uniref:hypothetical protein n=1 Tax=Actinokineospora enzanensis TaxID=155975 RepID=UPI000363B1FC|nr:hypothetical protein [Actinokineospora enzanensis]